MRYFALATDYDGTIAHDGRVSDETIAALRRLKETGRRLILVTGRELPELLHVFPEVEIFERVVAENGALLFAPGTKEQKTLGEPPPDQFVQELRERGVSPMSVGAAIVATWTPHETTVIQTIRDLGLELQVIFNKGAVMVLPSGVNKATGLTAALRDMQLSHHNTVAVGDAENDHALFSLCECSAAVANALPLVKERADITLRRQRGEGVSDLIQQILTDDLRSFDHLLTRHDIPIGHWADGAQLQLSPYGQNVLITGPSGSGKAKLAADLLERFAEKKYQFCVFDPEGDYADIKPAVVLGDSAQAPTERALLDVLKSPTRSAVVNLIGVPTKQRFAALSQLVQRTLDLRARRGRPHWLVIDEAQHALPPGADPSRPLPLQQGGLLLIADHPEKLAVEALQAVDLVLALGPDPTDTIEKVAVAAGQQIPDFSNVTADAQQPMAWLRKVSPLAMPFRPLATRSDRVSHVRKFLQGDVGREQSFLFAGPRGALRLRAQNLSIFMQIAEGVDDETWLHHLHQHDYSDWFRKVLRDDDLAAEVVQVESDANTSAECSRDRIRAAIERRYSLNE